MRLALTVASLILSCSPITAEDGSMGKLRTTFAPGLHSAILTTKHTVTPRQRKPGVEPQPLQLRPAFVTLPTRPVLRACLLPRVLLQASGGISAPPLKHVLEGEAKWRVATFHVCVSSSITLLEVFDLLLRLALSIFRAICAILHALGLGAVMTGLRTALAQGRAAAVWGPMPGPKQRVAIIGASFGGLACARMLRQDFDVTVIDQHDYFEYTPGILRLFIQPEHIRGLSASLRRVAGIKFVHGRVDHLGEKSVRVRPAKGASVSDAERLFGTKVAFDYGIIACGSAYSAGIKAGPSSALLQERAAFWKLQARRVAGAHHSLHVWCNHVLTQHSTLPRSCPCHDSSGLAAGALAKPQLAKPSASNSSTRPHLRIGSSAGLTCMWQTSA